MVLPILGYAATAAGGIIAGALLRQPEINRLKKQIEILQTEMKKLQALLAEQNRQIAELKVRYNVIKGYNFLLRKKFEGNIKGHIIHQYAFHEYVSLSKLKIKGVELNDKTQGFFKRYDKLIMGENLNFKEFIYMKKYLLSKYKLQIDQLIQVDARKTTALIGA